MIATIVIGISAMAHDLDADLEDLDAGSGDAEDEYVEPDTPQSEIEDLDKLCEELKKLKKFLENEEK